MILRVDDPALPCLLCVRVEGDPQEDEELTFFDAAGNALNSVYSGTHPECQQMLDDYEAERDHL